MDDQSVFPLTSKEWRKVCVESERQTAQGLFYAALAYLPDAIYPPVEVVAHWQAFATSALKRNQEILTVTASVCKRLKDAEVDAVLMKGQAVARYYEKPKLRACGDIDLYVPDESGFTAAVNLINKGRQQHKGADGSVSVLIDGVEVELHRHLIDIRHPKGKRTVSTLIKSEGYNEMPLISDIKIKVPAPIVTLLLLNAHIMKHALTVGVGLRQFCDLARAYYVLYGHYDPVKLAHVLQESGMARWSDLLHLFLMELLGLPADRLPYQPAQGDSRVLLRKVMEWGNFGQHTLSWQEHASRHSSMKLHTMKRIICGLPFSMRIAPAETLYVIKNLLFGQKYKLI